MLSLLHHGSLPGKVLWATEGKFLFDIFKAQLPLKFSLEDQYFNSPYVSSVASVSNVICALAEWTVLRVAPLSWLPRPAAGRPRQKARQYG